MKKDEIRAANRKALPRFLLAVVVCTVVGGVAGYGSAEYGLDELAGTIKSAGAFFCAKQKELKTYRACTCHIAHARPAKKVTFKFRYASKAARTVASERPSLAAT